MSSFTDKQRAELKAELADYLVLERFDIYRSTSYGDMAGARRGREVNRRGDRLITAGLHVGRDGRFTEEDEWLTADDYRAAFERILRPRYNRFRRSPGVTWGKGGGKGGGTYTREAASTQRVYERVARELGVEL